VHIAAWLHDCGKVTTPEFVVDKATKLETIYDRIHEVRMRIEVMKRDAEIAYLNAKIDAGAEPIDARAKLDAEIKALDEDFAFIAAANTGDRPMSDEDIERIRAIGQREWTRTIDDRLGLSHVRLTLYRQKKNCSLIRSSIFLNAQILKKSPKITLGASIFACRNCSITAAKSIT